MATWKFLHIACMFGAFGLGPAAALLVHKVVASGEVAVARRVLPTLDRIGNLVAFPLFVVGVGLGVVTALRIGYPLTSGWLITTYVLIGLIIVNGFAVYDPLMRRVKAAAANGDGGEVSSELARLASSWRLRGAFDLEVVLWVAVVFTMVTKPFS